MKNKCFQQGTHLVQLGHNRNGECHRDIRVGLRLQNTQKASEADRAIPLHEASEAECVDNQRVQ